MRGMPTLERPQRWNPVFLFKQIHDDWQLCHRVNWQQIVKSEQNALSKSYGHRRIFTYSEFTVTLLGYVISLICHQAICSLKWHITLSQREILLSYIQTKEAQQRNTLWAQKCDQHISYESNSLIISVFADTFLNKLHNYISLVTVEWKELKQSSDWQAQSGGPRNKEG